MRSIRCLVQVLCLTAAGALASPGAAPAAPAPVAPSVALAVQLSPNRLGAGTTLEFAVQITATHGSIPTQLSQLDLRYPANLGLITSGLGLATCTRQTLEEIGGEACPTNALMGHGTATVELPFGPETISETAEITIWMGPVQGGHLQLLFYANATHPSSAQLVFPGIVLEEHPPYGGDLATKVPELESFPEAPPASVVSLNASIGPKNVTYYHRINGKRIPYHPNGLRIPKTCPHGGFPFAGTFAFLNGATTTKHLAVPCPRRHART